MKTYFFRENTKVENSSICLGDFDGMHLGHRHIFELARKRGEFGAFLFEHNSKGRMAITTLCEKLEILKKMNAAYAIVADFSGEIKDRSEENFCDLLKELKISSAVVGYDYHFGKGAKGDADMLSRLLRERGIEVLISEPVQKDNEPIKSTKIRELIEMGKIEEANLCLGGFYSVSGKVVYGFQNGTKLGFPTCNIDYSEEKLLPKDGVYEGIALGFPAMINIGTNPTFDAKKRTVEAHILGFSGDLYGENLKLEFLRKIRDEKKFNSIEELINQLKADKAIIEGSR